VVFGVDIAEGPKLLSPLLPTVETESAVQKLMVEMGEASISVNDRGFDFKCKQRDHVTGQFQVAYILFQKAPVETLEVI